MGAEGLVNKADMEDNNNEEIMSPKSPKTPKLSAEVSEINLSNEVEVKEESGEEEECEDEKENENDEEKGESNDKFINDPLIINVLERLISNSPAGQVQKVSSLCTDLFPNYGEFIGKEAQTKMERDGYICDGKLVCEAVDDEDQQEPFKIELMGKLDNYVKELFPGNGAFSVNKVNEQEWKVHIVGERLKPKAFWSGHWRSTWTIRFIKSSEESSSSESSSKEFKIDGKIDLIVHYHEEGSVQLSANKEIPSLINFKSDNLSQSIEKIYFKIKDSEDAVQLALNEAYQQLSESVFKRLRRQLPVTRTKMDWGKFVNYNLSSDLKK